MKIAAQVSKGPKQSSESLRGGQSTTAHHLIRQGGGEDGNHNVKAFSLAFCPPVVNLCQSMDAIYLSQSEAVREQKKQLGVFIPPPESRRQIRVARQSWTNDETQKDIK